MRHHLSIRRLGICLAVAAFWVVSAIGIVAVKDFDGSGRKHDPAAAGAPSATVGDADQTAPVFRCDDGALYVRFDGRVRTAWTALRASDADEQGCP